MAIRAKLSFIFIFVSDSVSLTVERVMVESNVAFIVADAPPPHAERECWLETNLYNWHMEGREWPIFGVTFGLSVKTKQNSQ